MFSLKPDRYMPQPFDDESSNGPPHLRNTSWLEFEAEVLSGILPDLKRTSGKLTKRISTKRVHATRVVLRRWQATSRVITDDDWKLSKYQLLNKKLNKMRKRLGELRDCEILLELAEDLKLPGKLVNYWKKTRKGLVKKVEEYLKDNSPEAPVKQFERLIKARRKEFEVLKVVSQFGVVSAFDHLEPLLTELEEETRKLEPIARSPEELHQLRIKIKNWRYFLTEFYGLTNLQLVKAQQVLGKLHDLDRLLEVLKEPKESSMLDNHKLDRVHDARKRLLKEFDSLRKDLPYGLRPGIFSYAVNERSAKA